MVIVSGRPITDVDVPPAFPAAFIALGFGRVRRHVLATLTNISACLIVVLI